MGKMTVYHGGYTSVQHPGIIKGKNTKNFGNGFYCTVIREQAERWAKRYETPTVSIYTVQINFCTEEALKCLEFQSAAEVVK